MTLIQIHTACVAAFIAFNVLSAPAASGAEAPVASRPTAARIDTAKIEGFLKQQIEKEHYPSLSVGIVRDQELVFARAYGLADREAKRPATSETVYRIGSITKVFTSTLMCILRDGGRLQLDDPVAKYLPAGTRLPADPRGAAAITLRHLATHTSGLPRMPSNFQFDQHGGAHGYSPAQLYAALAEMKLQYPTGARAAYSNLGVGLLGHTLTCITHESYDASLKRYLLGPLGMNATGCELTATQSAVFAVGYKGEKLDEKAAPEDTGCLAGCGDLASNVPDMARFLSLQMRAGQPNVQPVAGGTLTEMHAPQRLMDNKWELAVGLGWLTTPGTNELKELGDIVWHNGATTGGYFAWMGFAPKTKTGVIVLSNGFKSVDNVGFALLAIAVKQLQAPTTASTALPPAEQVLDAFVEATGGAAAHRNLRTLISKRTVEVAGMKMTFQSFDAAPAKLYSCYKMGGVTISEEGSDGQTVWEQEMGSKPEIVRGDERACALREANVQQHVDWRKLFKQVRTTQQVRFHDRDCYEIELTPHEGRPETRWYDVSTKLLVGTRTEMEIDPMGLTPVEIFYSDYRKVGEVLFPFTADQSIGEDDDLRMTILLSEIKANVDIPAERFELPAAVKALGARAASRPEKESRAR